MTVTRTIGAAAIVVAVAASVAGCSGDDDTGEVSATGQAPTSEVREPRFTDQSARPDVIFDPCLDIPDEALVEAGLDPSTKAYEDYPGPDRTFLICAFVSPAADVYVNIASSNSTFDEYVAKEAGNDLREYELDGRRAVDLRMRSSGINCTLTVEIGIGIFALTRDLFERDMTREQWCDGMDDIARVFLNYLPEGA
ncbi:DUF3558 domain-containing protein [Rhodococcus triatomae]|nr:DUF3558 domain-containing protein [Rhodococcus triatomae]QNG20185.1 DUF3558 domain-containing protein [Rhodococcus triatomae]QNG23899.1 DUF3558 domain-containing protein [Rhodococcus triatomae]